MDALSCCSCTIKRNQDPNKAFPTGTVDKNILQVTSEDIDYFKRFKPLHYLTLQEMIRHGEAAIVQESTGA